MTSSAESSGTAASCGTIVVLIKDLFFAVTIRSTLRTLGFDAALFSDADQVSNHVAAADTRLVVVDGSAIRSAGDWERVGAIAACGFPVLVFGPHKDVETLRAAKEAGVTRVVANSLFHREMATLVERYALTAARDDSGERANGRQG